MYEWNEEENKYDFTHNPFSMPQGGLEALKEDNLESLYDRMSLIGRDLLLDTLPSIIDGTNSRTKQNEEEVTFGFNVKREEEHIDFNKSSRDVFNLITGALIINVFLGIIFDIIGVAVTSGDEVAFHSMSARKVRGGKIGVKLLKNTEKVVLNFCLYDKILLYIKTLAF